MSDMPKHFQRHFFGTNTASTEQLVMAQPRPALDYATHLHQRQLAPAPNHPFRKFIMPEITSHSDAQFHFACFTKEAHDLQPGLPAGPVRIRYSCHQWNEVVKRREPVYACYRASDRSSLGTWYKTALERFNK